MADEDILRGLQTQVTEQQARIRRNDAYYEGELRLAALGLSLPPEMRQLQTVVNWPRVVVDALEERITLTGFRMFGSDEPDDRLWEWVQINNLDEEAPLAHVEALIHGRAYVSVGYDDDNPSVPIIRCESPRNMAVDIDPRTLKPRAALRLYDQAPDGLPRSATLYQPRETTFWYRDQGRWKLVETIEGIGEVPVVPMVNRARLADRSHGVSEMADVMGITDAACRALTDLQGAQELLALPARFVTGITDEDMHDAQGNPIPKWQAYIGRFNTLADPEAKVFQLAGADLSNFTRVLDKYAGLVSSVTGLPPHVLGLTSENPASADAIRSAEARHVKRAEAKCRVVGGAWENVMRLGMKIVDGDVPTEAKRMEAVFADPATPTKAQTTDAVVKLVQAGVLPVEAAWEELGYSAEKRRRLSEMQRDDALSQLVRSVGADRNTAQLPGVPGDDGLDADGLGGITS